MLNQSQLKGTVVSPGYFRPSKGQAWPVFKASEATAEYGMPEGAVLVLKDGDNKDISEDSINRASAVIIEQHDARSYVAKLCQKARVPCIVGVSGITNKVDRREYLEVDPRTDRGTIYNFSPGFFGRVSNFVKKIRTKTDQGLGPMTEVEEQPGWLQRYRRSEKKNDFIDKEEDIEEKPFGVDLNKPKEKSFRPDLKRISDIPSQLPPTSPEQQKDDWIRKNIGQN